MSLSSQGKCVNGAAWIHNELVVILLRMYVITERSSVPFQNTDKELQKEFRDQKNNNV